MKNLFLEGPSGCGKTTLLLDALGPDRLATAGGYLTVRLHNADGSRAGFRVIRACEATSADEQISDDTSDIFIRITPQGRSSDEAVFTSFAAAELRTAEAKAFMLMDEFGGIELLNSEFYLTLQKVLKSPIPTIGVLKCPENAKRMAGNLAMGSDYPALYEQFRAFIINETDSRIVDTTDLSRSETAQIVSEWMKKNLV